MSASIQVTERNALDQLPKAIEESVREIKERAAQIVLEEAQSIIESAIFDEGELAGSGRIEVDEDDIQVLFDAPYAGSVEFGRDPGSRPPLEPILEWVKRRLGITDEKRARRVAWAICDRIEERGIPARPFLRPARAKGAQYLQNAGAELERKLGQRVRL